MESRLSRYYRARRKFALTVYILLFIFIILAVAQWTVVLEIKEIPNFIIVHYFFAPTFLLLALIFITFFVMFDNLRFIFPINWILTLFIIEFVIWGAVRIALAAKPKYFYFSCLGVFIFLVILLILGSCLRHDLTLDIVVLCVFTGVFIVLASILLMVFLVTYMPYILLVCACISIIIVSMFVMYHVQTVNGGRYAEMRLDDYLLAVLILFHDYVIILMSIYYLVGKITEHIYDETIFNLDESNSTTVHTPSPCICTQPTPKLPEPVAPKKPPPRKPREHLKIKLSTKFNFTPLNL